MDCRGRVVIERTYERDAAVWDELARLDPAWAVCSTAEFRGLPVPSERFWMSGADEVEAILRWLNQAGVRVEYRSALDFGCGLGRLSRPLARCFTEVVGVDISRRMIESANRLHADCATCRFELNLTSDLRSFPTERFDFVLSLIALQHIRERSRIETFLAEFVRVLSPNGVGVVQIPGRVPRRVSAHPARIVARLGGAPLLSRCPRLAPYSMAITGLGPDRVRQVIQAAGGHVAHVVEDNRVGSRRIRSFSYVLTRA